MILITFNGVNGKSMARILRERLKEKSYDSVIDEDRGELLTDAPKTDILNCMANWVWEGKYGVIEEV